MPTTASANQQFLDDLDKKLWNTADRRRSNLDAAVDKHAVLGLIFLKYVSDAFDRRREEIKGVPHEQRSVVVRQKHGHMQERLSWNVRVSA